MPKFSEKSQTILMTCHPKLISLANLAIQDFDFAVISGFRSEDEQNQIFLEKKSHLTFPHSKHNQHPSMAFDLAPWPIDWEDRSRFILLGGYMMGLAKGLGIDCRWGGDWNGDFNMKNQRFHDLGHLELLDEEV